MSDYGAQGKVAGDNDSAAPLAAPGAANDAFGIRCGTAGQARTAR
jgi:hypothetical protein